MSTTLIPTKTTVLTHLTPTAEHYLHDVVGVLDDAQEAIGPDRAQDYLPFLNAVVLLVVGRSTRHLCGHDGRTHIPPLPPRAEAVLDRVRAALKPAEAHDLDDPEFNGEIFLNLLIAIATIALRRAAIETSGMS